MLDIQFIRDNADRVREGVAKKGYDPKLVNKVLAIDTKRRDLLQKVEELRRSRNEAAKKRDATKGAKIKASLQKLEPELERLTRQFTTELSQIPNLPTEGVPVGGEGEGRIIKKVGKPREFSFIPKGHVELGKNLGIIDIDRAVKVSGSRFAYLKGDAVLLELALVNFALSKLSKEGFTPVFPPMLIKKEITEGLGYWHGGGNENYYLVNDFEVGGSDTGKPLPLYLVGTGEHSVVPMHAGEVLDSKELPLRYVAFSSCFRREAGSYGKDTRGILRVHQFDKVEMVSFVLPEDEKKEHEKLLSLSESLMQDLELPYQVVELASRDIGFPTARTYDIETWIPSQGKYRETHSISTTTDYQARRLDIRYETPDGRKYVSILNGTAFAIGRTIIAILENFQAKDGSVVIPKVLRPYIEKDVIQ